MPKKVAEQFARSFFDTIVDALSEDDSVKINGLGTFRVIDVASRESINVTNGERIVIAGYRKVNFIPEDGLLVSNLVDNMVDVREELGPVDEEEPVEDQETEAEGETADADISDEPETEVEDDVDYVDAEVNAVVAPSRVEVAEDDFSGIDMLICTPESVEEVRLELEEARIVAERKLNEAKAARKEVLRLEAFLEKLENRFVPECVMEEEPEDDAVTSVEPEGDISETEDAVAASPLVAESVSTIDDSISVELPKENCDNEPNDTIEDGASDADAVEPAGEVTESAEEVVEEVTPESADAVESEESQSSDNQDSAEEFVAIPSEQEEDVPETVKQEDVEPSDVVEPVAEEDEVELVLETEEQSDGVQCDSEQEETVVVEEPTEEPTEEDKSKEEALNRFLTETPKIKEEKKQKQKKEETNYWIWVLIPLVVVLLAGGAIIGFKYHSDKEKEELKQLPVKPKSNATPVPSTPTVKQKSVQDESAKGVSDTSTDNKQEQSSASGADAKATQTSKAETPEKKGAVKQKAYVLQKGESLTRVSQKFYNTKDSVRAIIRVNNFKDVDNVPYGTEIVLP